MDGKIEKQPSQAEELRENLRSIELLYQEGIGCDLELEAGCRLRGEEPGRGHCIEAGAYATWNGVCKQ